MTLHQKAEKGLLEDEILTTELLNERDKWERTVWHVAARHDTLNQIPKHLFNRDSFAQTNIDGDDVWDVIANRKQIHNVPLHLITEDLLDLRCRSAFGQLLFKGDDAIYIQRCLFLKQNPQLEKDFTCLDSRLKLVMASKEMLSFQFEGINDEIFLTKDNVFFNFKNFDSMSSAVNFIENNYPGVEKSIALPSETLNLAPFVL